MGNLFTSTHSTSSSKKGAVNDADRAVLALKVQRKKLTDQQALLHKRVDTYHDAAAGLVREGRRDAALLTLRKKRLVEGQLSALDKLVIDIEAMVSGMETTKAQATTVQALQQGNTMLQQLQKAMPLEEVQRLMDETSEAKEYQEELSRILGESLNPEQEAAAEEELAMLVEEAHLDEKQALPTAPKTKVATKEVEGAAEQAPAAAAAGGSTSTKAQQQQQQEEEEAEAEEGRVALPA